MPKPLQACRAMGSRGTLLIPITEAGETASVIRL